MEDFYGEAASSQGGGKEPLSSSFVKKNVRQGFRRTFGEDFGLVGGDNGVNSNSNSNSNQEMSKDRDRDKKGTTKPALPSSKPPFNPERYPSACEGLNSESQATLSSVSSAIDGATGQIAPGVVKHDAGNTYIFDASNVTFLSQKSLPRLPIPDLKETLDKFLVYLEALHTEAQHQAATNDVQQFVESGDGPRLQQLLIQYDKEGQENGSIGSYVEEFWNDSYLAPDASVVLNLNPFFVLEQGPDPKIAKDPIRRAASLCFASIKLASQLRNEHLRPDMFKGKPLCMDQFKALFGAARIPNLNANDTVHVYDKSNHIVVMYRGMPYYFQAMWPNGDVAVDEDDVIDILGAIQNHASTNTDDIEAARSALGILTSLGRNEWAKAREEFIKASSRNKESLQIIDSALFVLVLDEYVPKDGDDMAANMLHGSYELVEGPHMSNNSMKTEVSHAILDLPDCQVGSCCNRWYDKLQIIVCADGTAGINFEHSAIDGHTALRFVSDVYAETVVSFAQSITDLVHAHDKIPDVIHAKVRRAATTLDTAGRIMLDVFPKKIPLDLTDSMRKKIYYAGSALGDEIYSSDTKILEFSEYGKLLIVANKLSPDSFVQMSIMLAYFKLYGRIACAYEPVLTKSFFHGRTEAMRPATMEAKRLCEVWCSHASKQEKLKALRVATVTHSNLVRECAKGKGVDRHLFALKCIAKRNKIKTAFFKSDSWNRLNHTVISTSNCGNPALRQFGFGPVVPNGLGIGYIIKDNSLHYSVSSKHRQTARYVNILKIVLKEMQDILRPLTLIPPTSPSRLRSSLRSSLRPLMVTHDSYGDIWGESMAITPDPGRWTQADGAGTSLPEDKVVVEDSISGEESTSVALDDGESRWEDDVQEVPKSEDRRLLLKRTSSSDSIDTIPVVPSRRASVLNSPSKQENVALSQKGAR